MKVYIEKTKNPPQKYILIHVNHKEAGLLISSLALQLASNDPNNSGRQELVTENQEHFTIFVDPIEVKTSEDKMDERIQLWINRLPKKDRERAEEWVRIAREERAKWKEA